MSPQVRELLAELCQRAEGDLLFTDEQGRRLKRASVDHFFRKACRGGGITGFRFHDLRHENGSRLGDADVNLKKIARLMGHSNTKQTERYVHPTNDGLPQATAVAERGAESPNSSRNRQAAALSVVEYPVPTELRGRLAG